MPLVFSAVGQSKLFAQMYFNSPASGVLASVASSIWSAHKKWHQTKATSQFRKNYQGKKKIFNLFFFCFFENVCLWQYDKLRKTWEKPKKHKWGLNLEPGHEEKKSETKQTFEQIHICPLNFQPQYLSISGYVPRFPSKQNTCVRTVWPVKFSNFWREFRKSVPPCHLDPDLHPNLMWLNAALTWQTDLKRREGQKEESSEENAFTAGASLPPQRAKYLFLSSLPFFVRPSLHSVLPWWLVPPRGARVWKRPTEGWWGPCVCVCVHMYGCVRRQCIGRNPGACLPVLSVCLVLVSTPHSLIKGWAKPLTGRLNLKG